MSKRQKVFSVIIIAAVLMISFSTAKAADMGELIRKSDVRNKGIWVTCFTDKEVLTGRGPADELLSFCSKYGINNIYIQVYRAGTAYYESDLADDTPYIKNVERAGEDVLNYLLDQADRKGISVFAWVNLLSLAQNRSAEILKKYGDGILTLDQRGRPSVRTDMQDESDKYYLRDTQIFLEPGDKRVSDYLVNICSELLRRYPKFKGVHMDYIRYPHPVGFIPGSRFNDYGLTYGYGKASVQAFIAQTGIDPLKISGGRSDYQIWDDWKRSKVTDLVSRISSKVKSINPEYLISAAVIASPERAYLVAFQDWPYWLEHGFIDYAVLMDYTEDIRFFRQTLRSAMGQTSGKGIYAGIGLFLMENNPYAFVEEMNVTDDLKPDGVVFFSYDNF